MTALHDHICDVIRSDGPMTVARYMEICLTHPEQGYYTTRDPLGAAGDFTTAPEVSQMFGELIGLFLADYWLGIGRPSPVHLIELGPGRGTLMADALRAMKIVPDLTGAVQVHFIEVSPALEEMQKKAVPGASWPGSLDEIPPGFCFVVANEFFDCLPVRQFIKTSPGWAERMVALEDGKLVFTQGEVAGPLALPEAGFNPGDIIEACPQGAFWISAIAQRLKDFGGLALIIDYGYGREGAGDTFQAVKNHKPAAVLESPGQCDLTAHVNFVELKEKAEQNGLTAYGPVAQGIFLQNIGIEARAGKLLDQANKKHKKDILSAVKRLVSKDEMGELFKVLCLAKKGEPAPAGFDQDQ